MDEKLPMRHSLTISPSAGGYWSLLRGRQSANTTIGNERLRAYSQIQQLLCLYLRATWAITFPGKIRTGRPNGLSLYLCYGSYRTSQYYHRVQLVFLLLGMRKEK